MLFFRFVAVLLSVTFFSQAWARSGEPDLTFAGRGWQEQGLSRTAFANAIVEDSNRRVVMAYTGSDPGTGPVRIAVARYLDGGAPDVAFGTGGVVELFGAALPFLCAPEMIEDVAGHLLVASCDAQAVLVWRLLDDGSFDTSYGVGGLARVDVGGGLFPVIGLTQYKGRALVAASSNPPGAPEQLFTLVRLTYSGQPDTSLAGTGIVRHEMFPNFIGTESSRATDVAIDQKGRIVMAGRGRSNGSVIYMFAAARLNWNGALDTSFGNQGTVHFQVGGGPSLGRRVALDRQGRIVMAGTACLPNDPVFGTFCFLGVARLMNDGALDTSLSGGTGTLVLGDGGGPADPDSGFGNARVSLFGLGLQGDRILLAGGCDLLPLAPPNGERQNIGYIVALDGNGDYDTSFGQTSRGFSYYDFNLPYSSISAVRGDSSGRIIGAGLAGKYPTPMSQSLSAVAFRVLP